MHKPSDEALIAYLDGELDNPGADEVQAALARDPALARHAASLRESAALLRMAFDSALHEPLPERLVAAARGIGGEEKVVRFPEPRAARARAADAAPRRRLLLIAASVAGLLIGGGIGYLIATSSTPVQVAQGPAQPQTQVAADESGNWLDNIAAYHRMLVNAGANDVGLVDIPADPKSDGARAMAQQLPPDFRMPNLKPWGLVFQGARFLFVDGRPGTQLFYTTEIKSLGPLTVLVATTALGDATPAWERHGDLNVLYWRHQGHVYALVGSADIGYLWNIHNDLAWQLNAI
jgi:anti-sigma factor RsiW